MLQILLYLAILTSHISSSLTITTFNNSAISLPSSSTFITNATSNFQIPNTNSQTLSSIITGSITFPSLASYTFQCKFAHTSMGFFWIDGHLLCQDGNVYNVTESSTDNPLPIRRRTTFPFRVHMYKNVSMQELMTFSVQWSDSNNPFTDIPSTAITSNMLNPNEQKRTTANSKTKHEN